MKPIEAGLIEKSFVRRLRSDNQAERIYDYVHQETSRQFVVSVFCSDVMEFYVQEMRPNGRMFETGQSREDDRFWGEPRIQEAEALVGPNNVMTSLLAMGLNPDQMIFTSASGAGKPVVYGSLKECAEAIADALVSNVRYTGRREPTLKELHEDALREASSKEASRLSRRVALERAMKESSGLFQGCGSMTGQPLSDEAKHKILSYINSPGQSAWLDIRGMYIVGGTTLWQSWCAVDGNAARSGRTGFPDPDTVKMAIRAEVARQVEEFGVAVEEAVRPRNSPH